MSTEDTVQDNVMTLEEKRNESYFIPTEELKNYSKLNIIMDDSKPSLFNRVRKALIGR